MNNQWQSLLNKEWIKLRRGIWLLPLLLIYAATDTLLNLHALHRHYGPFGLWETVIFKQPQFFSTYMLLVACGVITGFLQARPESSGKRLRLLFHTPTDPSRIITLLLMTGTAILLCVNITGLTLLGGILSLFHFPWNVTYPVLLTVLPWCMLGFIAYLATVSFFLSSDLPIKLLSLLTFFPAWMILATKDAYGLSAPSLWTYALATICYISLVYYTSLRFTGEPSKNPFYSIARIISITLATCGLSAILLILYWRVATPAKIHKTMLYSPIYKQFMFSHSDPDKVDEQCYMLENGTSLTRKAYRSGQPFLYVRDLEKWGTFPESIDGIPITPQQARHGWQFTRLSSRDFNAPPAMLYMMLESNPQGARLQKPSDFFRVIRNGNAIEFISPYTGVINRPKSIAFTEALRTAGFIFPITSMGGNPDIRKEYDAGYFLTDANGALFQLQMTDNKPSCRATGQRITEQIEDIVIKEHPLKKFFGFIITKKAVYAIMQEDCSLKSLPVDDFNAEAFTLTLWSDLLHSSFITRTPGRETSSARGIAISSNFKVIHAFTSEPDPNYLHSMSLHRTIASFLFPVQITQSIPGSSYRHLIVTHADNPREALAGSVFALLLVFLIPGKSMRRSLRGLDYGLIAIFGLTAALIIFLTKCRDNFFWKRT